jgi:DNA polymerase-3 subunit beta
MRFSALKSIFHQQLALISSVIPARPSHPVLANVLIEATELSVVLTGYDLMVGIQTKFEATVIQKGSFTLPVGILKSLISKFDEGEIDFTLDSETGTVQIQTATGEFKIQGIPSDQYPQLPVNNAQETITIPVNILRQGLSATLFASSKEETKQILTGVYITKNDTKLEFAATDGHRLAVCSFDVDENIQNFTVVIPAFALSEVSKLINASKVDEISIEVTNKAFILFKIGNYLLTSRILEGTFPAYRQLIPKNYGVTAILDKKQLIDKISIISIIAESKNHLIKFILENDALTLEASNENGFAKEKLDIKDLTEPLTVAFNYKYLIDGLKSLVGEKVIIKANDPKTPVIFSLFETTEYVSTYLVMPVQIVR